MKTVLIAFVLIFIPQIVFGFDVNGFITNMSKSEVKRKFSPSVRVSEHEKETLVAQWQDGSYMSFNFCEDLLVSIQHGHPANLRNYTLLVAEFNGKYGQPFSINAGSRSHPNGQIHELGAWWSDNNEYISVYYMGLPDGESMSTSHQAPNKCFKVPR
ncbi:MAG: hypothetical protein N0C84_09835 [Candidatus Thiodiazotropha taylori]|uniref:Uncharacterized protein n=1 Tax=Candidatus Thiodiazotropha taylori TaxID=2792791 RepID=A0A9E4N3N1_9GAMM|nr:hypothetical protein [Candidatus Thiodiazotropha taylori]MCW4256747.1 hypothetical protein [Candidatus Thiodiazotropha taylori]